MTVEQIKQAVRPIVQEIAREGSPKKSGASSSGSPVGKFAKAAGGKTFAGSRVPNHNNNCRPTYSITRSEQFVGKPGGKVPRDAFATDASRHDSSRGLLSGKSNAWDNAGATTLHRRRDKQRSINGNVGGFFDDVRLGPARSEGLHPGGDSTDECRPGSISEGNGLDRKGLPLRLKGDDDDGTSWNPWALNQQLKRGVANMVSQAWDKHERDRRLVSQSRRHVLEALEIDWWQSMEAGMNEAFITAVDFGDQVTVSEVFTHTQRVINEAARRGHKVGTPLSLQTGWDFLREEDREAGKALVKREKQSDQGWIPMSMWRSWNVVGRFFWSMPWSWRRSKQRASATFFWRILWQARRGLRRTWRSSLKSRTCTLAVFTYAVLVWRVLLDFIIGKQQRWLRQVER